MKNLNFLVLLLMVLLLAACQNETELLPEVTEVDTEKFIDLPPLTGEVDADLEMLYKEADLTEDASKKGPSIQFLLPGSTTGDLAVAISAAGNGGVVVILPGTHTENNPVVISHRVTILGLPGSTLLTGTQAQPYNPNFTINADAFFHIKNANHVILAGINMTASSTTGGGVAILLENADRAYISRNTINEYQFSVLVEQSDRVKIWNNDIDAFDFTQHTSEVHGIVVVNGKHAQIVNNTISQAFFGIWACDEFGKLRFNTCNGNYHGIILCKVPAGALILPGGNGTGAQIPCTSWQVSHNTTNNNFDVGIVVIDGATNNQLVNNSLSGNGFYPFLTGTTPLGYEMELTGNTTRFGFLSPEATNNTVISGSGVTIKDCGTNNQVVGGTLVPNTVASPCR